MEAFNSTANCAKKIKFLCSYGGKIIPRPSDGLLRYIGGYTRILSVDRFVTFSELMVKFGEACGSSMNLTCKLPSEDLELLISVKSDEDLRNVIEEYERVSLEMKIRAVLFPIKSVKKVSAPSSPMSCFDFPLALTHQTKMPPASEFYYADPPRAALHKFCEPAVGYPVAALKHRGSKGRSSSYLHNVSHRNYSHPHYQWGESRINDCIQRIQS